MDKLSESFGTRQVTAAQREALIRGVFRRVARRYDLMNDLMSFGIHRLWKRSLAWAVDPRPGQVLVDLAGGTGDVADKLAGHDRTVIVVDPSDAMMRVGRETRHHRIRWTAGTAEAMPLAEASVDTVTMAFGIRNVTRLEDALAEVRRVLKPGGRFLCLEFSRPAAPLRPVYERYNEWIIPRLGAAIARDPEAYQYLIESIRRFPDQETFRKILEDAGFEDVRFRNVSFGIACIHIAVRP
jgi:demethylmenaquinone methyltransferase/2-methoxy-6-polyprenyl-1,4-benzoquinol methylase